ncbi:MAG: response regulator transcription factor [Pseudomonadota bacterium]
MHVLIVEDDPTVAEFAARGLRESGCQVDLSQNGREGLEMAYAGHYDVLVVDRMLPGMDGLELIRALRSAGIRTPTLVLSAMGSVEQRVAGLEAGSDDYLPNPFAFSELLARVNALHRRVKEEEPEAELRVGDLLLDRLARRVERDGVNIALQPREFRLLEYLMLHADRVVTRTMLLEKVWDYHFDPQTNVIDVHISRLRNKIDRGHDQALIQTVRGAGYRLTASPASGP